MAGKARDWYQTVLRVDRDDRHLEAARKRIVLLDNLLGNASAPKGGTAK